MQQSRRPSILVGALAVVLLLLVQLLSWYKHRHLNPGAFLALALVLPPLWIALRRSGTDGSEPPQP